MNRLQDCFDDDDTGDEIDATPEQSTPPVEGIDYIYNPQARDAGGPLTYDAYGQQQPAEGQPAADVGESGEGFNHQFQGMAADPAKPLCEDRPRGMHPGVARWMDQEPLGYVDGLNWYNAPPDEPVNRVDPLGT